MMIFLVLITARYGYCNAIELEDRDFIISIGIDNKLDNKDKNKLEVTTLSADMDYFKKKSTDSNKKYTESVLVESLNDGLNMINNKSDKNIYLGHAQILFIDKKLFDDKKTLSKIIHDIENNSHINQKIKIIFVDNAKKTINSQFVPDLLKHIKNKPDTKSFDIRTLSKAIKNN